MRVLIINKFLHPNGGSETYIFKLGEYLADQGHEVQYFGMDHVGRCVGNRIGAYTSDMDFHEVRGLAKIGYAFRSVYSKEARTQIRKVLDDFLPEVCHINNFNYQLTPSIILEIEKWKKQNNTSCRIVFTAHDYQLICPNHMCLRPATGEICEKCFGGKFINCVKSKCIHESLAKSVIGAIEGYFWNALGIYNKIDTMICCSEFLKTKMDTNPVFAKRTVTIHNFIDRVESEAGEKNDYVLYFGRYSSEKGVETLISVAKEMPELHFIFAGAGPLENMLEGAPNIENVGFQSGDDLRRLISKARLSVYPSEWYENCPFSVMESQMYGTPVLGADIGGIPELIALGKTGELFESGNMNELKDMIKYMLVNSQRYEEGCRNVRFNTVSEYSEKLLVIYKGENDG